MWRYRHSRKKMMNNKQHLTMVEIPIYKGHQATSFDFTQLNNNVSRVILFLTLSIYFSVNSFLFRGGRRPTGALVQNSGWNVSWHEAHSPGTEEVGLRGTGKSLCFRRFKLKSGTELEHHNTIKIWLFLLNPHKSLLPSVCSFPWNTLTPTIAEPSVTEIPTETETCGLSAPTVGLWLCKIKIKCA